jgi:acetylornithine deacetylase/succinyl-diaminopimelate desuccinylase family protein
MRVEVDEFEPGRANVIGRLSGTSTTNRSLMFNGHLDVVPSGEERQWDHPPFEPTVVNDRLFGRGACDMKGGIASILAAVKSVIDDGVGLKGDLLVSFVADEESFCKGVNRLIERGVKADMAVIAEPTRLQVTIAHKGIIWFQLTVFGKSAHASTVKSGGGDSVNAIYKMGKALSVIENQLPQLETRKHKLVGNPTVNVGTISGGTKPNVVPDSCTATVERRLLPGEQPDVAEQELRNLLDSIAKSDPTFRYELTRIIVRHAAEVSENEPIVNYSRKAVCDVTGTDPGVRGFIATSDMANLVRAKIPTILLGPGDLTQAHAPNEFIETEQLVIAAQIYERLIIRSLT